MSTRHSSPSWARGGTFTPGPSIGGLNSSYGFTLGDFNGDGKIDVAGQALSGGIAWFRGDGAGGFAAALITGGLSAVTWAAGDVNGDGKLDVLAGSMLALGRGDGSFDPPIPTGAGGTGYMVVLEDFNGDGKLDVVTHTSPSGAAKLWIGNGTGAFTLASSSRSGDVLTTGDLDGDGKLDLITVGGGSALTVLRGTGAGTFHPATRYLGSSTVVPVLGDFDADGHLDVVIATTRGLQFHHGNGDGTLQGDRKRLLDEDPSHAVGTPSPMAIADFNGDGKTDAVVATSGNVLMLPASGGTLGAPVALPLPPLQSATAVAAGDVNGDGKADVVFVSLQTGGGWSLSSLLGHGDGTFTASATTRPIPQYQTLTLLADVTGDGHLDAMTGSNLYTGNGDGTFGAAIALPGAVRSTADFNGDGVADIVTTETDTGFGEYRVSISNGNGTFTTAAPTGSSFLTAGDLNGDGRADIVDSGSGFRIRLGKADGSFDDRLIQVPIASPAVIADFDGDGSRDIALGNLVLLGDGAGSIRGAASSHLLEGLMYAAGDVDGNGSPDILALDKYQGAIDTLLTRVHPIGSAPFSLPASYLPDPIHYLGGITVTATPASPTAWAPSGGIVVRMDGVVSGVGVFGASFAGDSASVSMGSPAVGLHQLTVSFTGDETFPATSVTFSPTVERALTGLYIFVQQEPSEVNQVAGIRIRFPSVNSFTPALTGTMTVREGPTTWFTTAAGDMNTAFKFLTPGTHPLTVEYSGDATWAPATATVDHIVIRAKAKVSNVMASAASIDVGQSVTIQASIFAYVTPSGGTMSFLDQFGHTVGSIPLSGTTASLTIQPPAGEMSYFVRYDGDANVDASDLTGGAHVTVSAGPFGTPMQVKASYNGTVSLYATPVTGATSYEFYRSSGSDYSLVAMNTNANAFDSSVFPNHAYLYTVVARRNAESSAASPPDLVTTVAFTNDPLVPGVTPIKAVHLTELRSAVNLVRALAGLAPATFDDPSPAGIFIRATHVLQLRSALSTGRAALGIPIGFTDATLTSGTTAIRAIHFQELRDGVK